VTEATVPVFATLMVITLGAAACATAPAERVSAAALDRLIKSRLSK